MLDHAKTRLQTIDKDSCGARAQQGFGCKLGPFVHVTVRSDGMHSCHSALPAAGDYAHKKHEFVCSCGDYSHKEVHSLAGKYDPSI